jgi:hypothetical protein
MMSIAHGMTGGNLLLNRGFAPGERNHVRASGITHIPAQRRERIAREGDPLLWKAGRFPAGNQPPICVFR